MHCLACLRHQDIAATGNRLEWEARCARLPLWLLARDLSFKHGSVEQVEEDIHRDACDLDVSMAAAYFTDVNPRDIHPREIDIHRSDMNVRWRVKVNFQRVKMTSIVGREFSPAPYGHATEPDEFFVEPIIALLLISGHRSTPPACRINANYFS